MSDEARHDLDSLVGVLLVAMPSMDDPRFARSVILVCQHGSDGAMGLVVNRLAEYHLRDVFEQMQITVKRPPLLEQPVLQGGPVHSDRGFVLHDGEREWDSSLRVGASLAVTTSRDVLEALARDEGPRHFLLALGYAGWGEGQLEAELAENAWLTVPADADLLFDVPLEQRWAAANSRLGFDPRNLAGYAGHA
ncbi:MAG: YqgE/AlgH family protein [Xanthomonadaceae bacterium]|nr:YqgE/AlgH family protein [Xanthomonadaceae bacterium]